jgi:hypothetical protein
MGPAEIKSKVLQTPKKSQKSVGSPSPLHKDKQKIMRIQEAKNLSPSFPNSLSDIPKIESIPSIKLNFRD